MSEISKRRLRLLHMYPDLLDLYGDSGNVEVLRYRCGKRDIELEVSAYRLGDADVNFSDYDLIFFGGGADNEQRKLSGDLMRHREGLRAAYEDGVFLLMICGGYQLMGQYYLDADGDKIQGLGLFPYHTIAPNDRRARCIGNIIIDTQIAGGYRVIGFENHGGQTFGSTTPFGKVVYGNGNSRDCGEEGYLEKNVIATYLHGPLLSKNPLLCDHIIAGALAHSGQPTDLCELDDSLENECREVLFERFIK